MKKSDYLYDLKSSVVVFLVALPLCLGIALASGAPLASGLIAGVVGGVVVGLLSNSHISVSGPAAGLTVIVASGITSLGGFEKFSMAIILAGLFQVAFSLFKGGALGDYFPVAVIKGMLAAIGLILISKQLPVALGLPPGSFDLTEVNKGIVILTLVSLGLMLTWDKIAAGGNQFFKLVPSPLIAVIVTIVLNETFQLVTQNHLVSLPSSIFSGLKFPDFSFVNIQTIQMALTIAVVASLETLLCIDAADKIDTLKRKTDKNRELLAQGLGNAISGVLGGLPLTAVIVRTSANVAAGAKSKYSAVFHGGWILLSVFFFPNILNLIPLATLACVLLLVGYKLTKPDFYYQMWKRGPDQLFIFVTTIGAILATDLLKGIFIGLFVAILFELKKPSLSSFEVEIDKNKMHLKFKKNVSFFHKPRLAKILGKVEEISEIHFYDLEKVRVHVDVHEFIQEFHEESKKMNKLAVHFK